jgi:hypothetical protein
VGLQGQPLEIVQTPLIVAVDTNSLWLSLNNFFVFVSTVVACDTKISLSLSLSLSVSTSAKLLMLHRLSEVTITYAMTGWLYDQSLASFSLVIHWTFNLHYCSRLAFLHTDMCVCFNKRCPYASFDTVCLLFISFGTLWSDPIYDDFLVFCDRKIFLVKVSLSAVLFVWFLFTFFVT